MTRRAASGSGIAVVPEHELDLARPIWYRVVVSKRTRGHNEHSFSLVPVEAGDWDPREKECFLFTSNADRTLTCADCGQTFAFTASEQQFYADRGFSEPRRCPSCRSARKAARGDAGSGFGGGYAEPRPSRGPREMFTATCASCGREAQVPFRPNGMKPVYCSDCFSAQRR